MLGTFDAVFLGIGLGRTATLDIEGEDLEGVWEALDFIFQTHTRPFTECVVGKDVVVIGAGNTAIDVATAATPARGRDGHHRLSTLGGGDPRLRL